MSKKKLSLIAIVAHLIVAAIAIRLDLQQPPGSRTAAPLIAGYIATALIAAVVLFLGNERVVSRAQRIGTSLVLSLIASGFLWIATFSVFLLVSMLFRGAAVQSPHP